MLRPLPDPLPKIRIIQHVGGDQGRAALQQVVLPKTHVSEEAGYIAMFIDTEGNRVALHSPN